MFLFVRHGTCSCEKRSFFSVREREGNNRNKVSLADMTVVCVPEKTFVGHDEQKRKCVS